MDRKYIQELKADFSHSLTDNLNYRFPYSNKIPLKKKAKSTDWLHSGYSGENPLIVQQFFNRKKVGPEKLRDSKPDIDSMNEFYKFKSAYIRKTIKTRMKAKKGISACSASEIFVLNMYMKNRDHRELEALIELNANLIKGKLKIFAKEINEKFYLKMKENTLVFNPKTTPRKTTTK